MTQLAVRPTQVIVNDLQYEYRQLEECRKQIDTESSRAMHCAITIGRLLAEMKDALPHGSWLSWLDEAAIPFSAKSASNYMRLYENRQTVADLPVGNALRKLAAIEAPPSETRETAAAMKELAGGATLDPATVESTATEDEGDPELLRIENGFAAVVGMLAEARAMNDDNAFERRADALTQATSLTRSLKAYQETA